MCMKRIIVVLFSSLFFSLQVSAQSVYAQVNTKRVAVGTPFEYAIVISVSATNYSPPNFKDFDVVSGPNQSSSVQYVNGAMSQQMIISYGLVAKREGKYTIGPAVVNAGNQRYETTPVSIEVVKAGGSAQSQQNDEPAAGVGRDDLYLKTTVSKNKCYLGEQITIVQKVYSRHQIIGYQKSVPPAYDGFYSQAQESPTKGQLLVENVDGVNYYTHELFRTIATPNKTGRITLMPPEAVPIVRRQAAAKPRNIFEQFFGTASYEDIPVPVNGRPTVVEVLPLPEDGRPLDFNGAVGNFSAKLETNRQQIKANEAFNLKLTISGKGNLKLINPPKLELPESFETYEPKTSDNAGSKSFDYLVIPRAEGQYTLNNLSFSFFNLDTKKYVTLPLGTLEIKVLPADPNSAGAKVFQPQNQVRETENDIRYIKKGNFVLTKTDTEFFNSVPHVMALSGIVALLGAGLVIRRRHIRNNSNMVLVRERKAARVARQKLLRAEKLMKENNKNGFYTEILTALHNYLSYKLNIAVADLSREKIHAVLQSKNVDSALQVKLSDTLDTSEYAKYAPGAVSGDLEGVYRDTVALITNLEQQLNRKIS
jgi:hypothetical protein